MTPHSFKRSLTTDVNLNFLADENFWEWMRTLAAALLGGLLGGLFTIRAQSQASADQRSLEAARIEAQVAQQRVAADERERDAKFLESREKAMELFEEYASLHRDLQRSMPTVSQELRGEPQKRKYTSIWTAERSLKVDVLRLLVADPPTRNYLERLGNLLDEMPALDPESPFGSERFSVFRTGLHLSAEGASTLALYLRREPFEAPHLILVEGIERMLAASNRAEYEAFRDSYEESVRETQAAKERGEM
jgi:uncharacterized membrane-anchored protein YhcB (DUF1043 family)